MSEGLVLHFYPELYLDPGSCGGNTTSTCPKSLVPGESSCGGNGAHVSEMVFQTVMELRSTVSLIPDSTRQLISRLKCAIN